MQFPLESLFYDYYTGAKIEKTQYKSAYIKFDDSIPLFIRGGKIVHTQAVDSVQRARYLDNKFILLIALNFELVASGQMMTINNYTDDSNILHNCRNGNDCIMNI